MDSSEYKAKLDLARQNRWELGYQPTIDEGCKEDKTSLKCAAITMEIKEQFRKDEQDIEQAQFREAKAMANKDANKPKKTVCVISGNVLICNK